MMTFAIVMSYLILSRLLIAFGYGVLNRESIFKESKKSDEIPVWFWWLVLTELTLIFWLLILAGFTILGIPYLILDRVTNVGVQAGNLINNRGIKK
jgi:hypothetical protein